MLETAQTQSVLEDGKHFEGQIVAGKFPLKQYLGGSARSAVFLTEGAASDSGKMAIKLIRLERDSELQLGRLRLATHLVHPHLLQIFEVGECRIGDEKMLFAVMEYADETLAQILPIRPLNSEEAPQMARPVLEALAYVHGNGCAHGRLKPANVLVVGEQLKLSLDSICRRGVLESPGKEGGPYDAPELSRDGFTPASDVWSFAVTVTEALTQRLPIWADRLRTEPTLPSSVPAPFAEIAAHCLRRDPASRWTVPQISARLDQNGIKPVLGKIKKPISISLPKIPKLDLPRLHLPKLKLPKLPKLQIPRPLGNWAYAVGMIAIIGIAILVASMLRPGSESKTGTAVAAPAVAASKPSPNPEKPRTARASIALNPAANSAEIVRQAMPEVSGRALRTIHGKVRVTVRVHVDMAGNVSRAEFVSSGPSRYFAGHAMQAAQNWKFVAGNSAHAWNLQFVFERSGASVQARKVS